MKPSIQSACSKTAADYYNAVQTAESKALYCREDDAILEAASHNMIPTTITPDAYAMVALCAVFAFIVWCSRE